MGLDLAATGGETIRHSQRNDIQFVIDTQRRTMKLLDRVVIAIAQ